MRLNNTTNGVIDLDKELLKELMEFWNEQAQDLDLIDDFILPTEEEIKKMLKEFDKYKEQVAQIDLDYSVSPHIHEQSKPISYISKLNFLSNSLWR